MSASRLNHVRRTLAGAFTFVSIAGAAHAQKQHDEKRFVRASAPETMAVARDSVARYLRLAHEQRRTGSGLLIAGLATIATAYVEYARSSGRIGMSAGQLSTFGAGLALGSVGASRWHAAQQSQVAAAWWATDVRIAERR